MEKVKFLYTRLSEKNFKIISIIFLFLGDTSLSLYMWFKFTDKKTFDASVNMALKLMKVQGAASFPPNFAKEIYQLMVQSLTFGIVMILGYHALIYLLFYLKKSFSYRYLKLMLFIAIPGSFLMGLTGGENIYFVLQSFLFLYVFIGITRFFPIKKT